MRGADYILRHQTAMKRLAIRYAKSSTDADDVFQTACMNALQVDPPKDLRNPRAWLCGFVRNAWRDHLRRESRYEQGGDELASRISVPPNQQHAAELSELLQRVGRLPDKQRNAFISIAVNENSTREAAAELGYRDNKGPLYHYRRARMSLGLAA